MELGAVRLYGYPKAEAVGRTIHNLLQTIHLLPFGEVLRALETTGEWTGELCHITKDGREVSVESRQQLFESNGRRLVLETNRDITEHKKAEEAMRVSEEKYRSLFNSMDEGFCIVQLIFDENKKPIDYRYIEINAVCERQTGMRNALGKTVRELVPGIEPCWFETYGKVALTGEPTRFEDHAASMGRWFHVNAFRIGEPDKRQVAVGRAANRKSFRSGLGLAISYGIIKEHDGTITVKSASREGTRPGAPRVGGCNSPGACFVIELPLVSAVGSAVMKPS